MSTMDAIVDSPVNHDSIDVHIGTQGTTKKKLSFTNGSKSHNIHSPNAQLLIESKTESQMSQSSRGRLSVHEDKDEKIQPVEFVPPQEGTPAAEALAGRYSLKIHCS